MDYQHSPDGQTLRLQAGAGEDDVIHLQSGLDRVDCERQEEEERWDWLPHVSILCLDDIASLICTFGVCAAPCAIV